MPPIEVSELPCKSIWLPLTVLFCRVSTVPELLMPVELSVKVEFEIRPIAGRTIFRPLRLLPAPSEESSVMTPANAWKPLKPLPEAVERRIVTRASWPSAHTPLATLLSK